MKKITVFGSKLCSDCGPAQETLTENGIKFIYLDITENLLMLKMFLKYRDSRPEFEEVRSKGSIGIPCIVVNDGEKVILDLADVSMDELR